MIGKEQENRWELYESESWGIDADVWFNETLDQFAIANNIN